MADRFKPWPAIIEELRTSHNGIWGVTIYFGHSGSNICQFSTADEMIAQATSNVSMQEAVEKCVEVWLLELQARHFAKNMEGIEL
jgi:hypothetical protein